MNVRERFNPVPLGVNGTYTVNGQNLGGFLAKVSGTITVASTAADGLTAVTLVDAVPVTAGVYTPIPIEFPYRGGTVTLAGGAAGTLFI